jgi:hypothetical protein
MVGSRRLVQAPWSAAVRLALSAEPVRNITTIAPTAMMSRVVLETTGMGDLRSRAAFGHSGTGSWR